MADVISNLNRRKKVLLPLGWVERFSKKHPDRPFYFNEKTGESRWSIPLDSDEKVEAGSSKKAKKRRSDTKESDDSSDTNSIISDIWNFGSINDRPKLITRRSNSNLNSTVGSDSPAGKEKGNDTPAMKAMREKIALKKEIEANKKKSPRASVKKPLQSPKSRITRNSSKASTESVSSDASTVSNSSMGTQIKRFAATINKTSDKGEAEVKKLPKIPRIQQTSTASASALESIIVLNNVTTEDDKVVDKISNTRKSFTKNTAHERMKRLRDSSHANINKDAVKRLHESSKLNNIHISSLPTIRNNAQKRLHSLESRVEKSVATDLTKTKLMKNNNDEIKIEKILDKINTVDSCEQMDWEPTQDDVITSEVYSVRHKLIEKPAENLTELSGIALQSADTVNENNALYIVIDTNVFLSNLSFIEQVRDSKSEIYGRPFIVIPWTVIQELDFIKDDINHVRSASLKIKARKAVEFLNRHFSAKHPRFLGLTPTEVANNKEKFMIECPDDEILQTCLQIKDSSKLPVLLSYDKNLCTKAMIHDIPVLGRDEPLEKIYYLKAAETTAFLSNSLHSRLEEKDDESTLHQKELLVADDIMEEAKAIVKFVFSAVVAKEMETLFGDRWQSHVIIRPPWSAETVLKCALKHWMAAVSESFLRRAEPWIKAIQQIIQDRPANGRKLQDVENFLDKVNDILQTLNASKYPNLKIESLTNIEKLRQRCLTAVNELKQEKFEHRVGVEENLCEVESKADLAFKVFETIYETARDVCGIVSEYSELQCSFTYNKLNPRFPLKVALQNYQDIGVNVTKLIQILKMSLNTTEEDSVPNDDIIRELYQVLINFSSDYNFEELVELTPLHLYCCLKLRKQKMLKGYEQLQELAVHFCRIANYQCANN